MHRQNEYILFRKEFNFLPPNKRCGRTQLLKGRRKEKVGLNVERQKQETEEKAWRTLATVALGQDGNAYQGRDIGKV